MAPAPTAGRRVDFVRVVTDDAAWHILSFVDAMTLARCMRVSAQWYGVACDNGLWEALCRWRWRGKWNEHTLLSQATGIPHDVRGLGAAVVPQNPNRKPYVPPWRRERKDSDNADAAAAAAAGAPAGAPPPAAAAAAAAAALPTPATAAAQTLAAAAAATAAAVRTPAPAAAAAAAAAQSLDDDDGAGAAAAAATTAGATAPAIDWRYQFLAAEVDARREWISLDELCDAHWRFRFHAGMMHDDDDDDDEEDDSSDDENAPQLRRPFRRRAIYPTFARDMRMQSVGFHMPMPFRFVETRLQHAPRLVPNTSDGSGAPVSASAEGDDMAPDAARVANALAAQRASASTTAAAAAAGAPASAAASAVATAAAAATAAGTGSGDGAAAAQAASDARARAELDADIELGISIVRGSGAVESLTAGPNAGGADGKQPHVSRSVFQRVIGLDRSNARKRKHEGDTPAGDDAAERPGAAAAGAGAHHTTTIDADRDVKQPAAAVSVKRDPIRAVYAPFRDVHSGMVRQIQVAQYPYLTVSRTPDWGWFLLNDFVFFVSLNENDMARNERMQLQAALEESGVRDNDDIARVHRALLLVHRHAHAQEANARAAHAIRRGAGHDHDDGEGDEEDDADFRSHNERHQQLHDSDDDDDGSERRRRAAAAAAADDDEGENDRADGSAAAAAAGIAAAAAARRRRLAAAAAAAAAAPPQPPRRAPRPLPRVVRDADDPPLGAFSDRPPPDLFADSDDDDDDHTEGGGGDGRRAAAAAAGDAKGQGRAGAAAAAAAAAAVDRAGGDDDSDNDDGDGDRPMRAGGDGNDGDGDAEGDARRQPLLFGADRSGGGRGAGGDGEGDGHEDDD